MSGASLASQPWQLTIVQTASKLRSGTLSSVELLESILARANATEPLIHAWVVIDEERAKRAALECDAELARGETRGPLHGIPVGLKDIYDAAGLATRCGSNSREDASPATRDAHVVHQLRDSGAIILGKTVTHEFAAGVISPPVRNPWDPDRIPGGSSGGTGAAIAAGSAMAGLGSDTGGSIRIPASLCGVVGFKPTYGVLSSEGAFPLAWSLDTPGPLGRTVNDVALMFRVMKSNNRRASKSTEPRPLRIGIPRQYFFERLQDGVESALSSAIDALRAAGIELVESPWVEAPATRECSYVMYRAEAAALHWSDMIDKWESYGQEFRIGIEEAMQVPAHAYIRAHQARKIIARSCARVFDDFELDAMLTPSTPGTAALVDDLHVHYDDESTEDAGLAYTRFLMPFNVTGQPALSIPCGWDMQGLPIGLQLAGKPHGDEELLSAGRQVEDALGFDLRFPLLA